MTAVPHYVREEPKHRSKRMHIADIDTDRIFPTHSREEDLDANAALMAAKVGLHERQRAAANMQEEAHRGKKMFDGSPASKQNAQLFAQYGTGTADPPKTHAPRRYDEAALAQLHRGGLSDKHRDRMASVMADAPSLMDRELQRRETERFYREPTKAPGPSPMAGKTIIESLTDHDKGVKSVGKKHVAPTGAVGEAMTHLSDPKSKAPVLPGLGGPDKYAAKFDAVRAMPQSPLAKLSSYGATDPIGQQQHHVGSPVQSLLGNSRKRPGEMSPPRAALSPIPALASPATMAQAGGAGLGMALPSGAAASRAPSTFCQPPDIAARGKKHYGATPSPIPVGFGDDGAVPAGAGNRSRSVGLRKLEPMNSEPPHARQMSSLDWVHSGFRQN